MIYEPLPLYEMDNAMAQMLFNVLFHIDQVLCYPADLGYGGVGWQEIARDVQRMTFHAALAAEDIVRTNR